MSSKTWSCLSVCEILKKLPRGLANVDMSFLTHIIGKCPNGSGSVKDTHLLQFEACYNRSQMKEACVLYVAINYITSVCTCRKKRARSSHRRRNHSQKYSQSNTYSFCPEPPEQPSSWVVGESGQH